MSALCKVITLLLVALLAASALQVSASYGSSLNSFYGSGGLGGLFSFGQLGSWGWSLPLDGWGWSFPPIFAPA